MGQHARIRAAGHRPAGGARDERGISPDRLAILAPVKRKGPARQALARIPLALPVMQEAAGGEGVAQAADEIVRAIALGGADRLGVPLGRLEIVDRNKGGLAAHGEPHILRLEVAIHCLAQRVELGPGLVRERRGDARGFADARHRHLEAELDFGGISHAADGRGGAVMGRGAEGNMPLPAEQAGRGVHADPACARQIDLGPGVQIGEVLVRAHGPLDGVHISLQLNEVARHETGREAKMAKDLHQQPRGVPAGAGGEGQRVLGLLNAGLHADDIADVALELRVERHQKVDGANARPCKARHHGADQRPRNLGRQIGGELMGELGLVSEGEGLRIGLDEEVEGIDHVHIGLEVDLDAEFLGLFREDEAGQPVAVGVLLPIHEMP